MKRLTILLSAILISLSLTSQVSLNAIKKQAGKTAKDISSRTNGKSSNPLTNDEIIKGLKEALHVGTDNASSGASKEDGFFKNPLIFIPFPPDVVKIETTLRNMGLGAKIDAFNKTL